MSQARGLQVKGLSRRALPWGPRDAERAGSHRVPGSCRSPSNWSAFPWPSSLFSRNSWRHALGLARSSRKPCREGRNGSVTALRTPQTQPGGVTLRSKAGHGHGVSSHPLLPTIRSTSPKESFKSSLPTPTSVLPAGAPQPEGPSPHSPPGSASSLSAPTHVSSSEGQGRAPW